VSNKAANGALSEADAPQKPVSPPEELKLVRQAVMERAVEVGMEEMTARFDFCPRLGKLLFWGPTPPPRRRHPGTVSTLSSTSLRAQRVFMVLLWVLLVSVGTMGRVSPG
jgi:hypothetical protein